MPKVKGLFPKRCHLFVFFYLCFIRVNLCPNSVVFFYIKLLFFVPLVSLWQIFNSFILPLTSNFFLSVSIYVNPCPIIFSVFLCELCVKFFVFNICAFPWLNSSLKTGYFIKYMWRRCVCRSHNKIAPTHRHIAFNHH